jgi:hypothetical protein
VISKENPYESFFRSLCVNVVPTEDVTIPVTKERWMIPCKKDKNTPWVFPRFSSDTQISLTLIFRERFLEIKKEPRERESSNPFFYLVPGSCYL